MLLKLRSLGGDVVVMYSGGVVENGDGVAGGGIVRGGKGMD